MVDLVICSLLSRIRIGSEKNWSMNRTKLSGLFPEFEVLSGIFFLKEFVEAISPCKPSTHNIKTTVLQPQRQMRTTFREQKEMVQRDVVIDWHLFYTTCWESAWSCGKCGVSVKQKGHALNKEREVYRIGGHLTFLHTTQVLQAYNPWSYLQYST